MTGDIEAEVAIDVARYYIPDEVEKFYLDATLPVPVPLVHRLVRPGFNNHNATR